MGDAAARDAIERWGDRAARLPFVRPHGAESLPVDINRRRIYVLPTGFGLFFAGLLGALLLGALNYNNNPGLVLGFLLVAIAHNSLVHAHLLLSGLRLAAVHAEPAHAGQTLTLRLRFENTSRRPRGRLELLGEHDLTDVELPAHSVTEASLRLPATQRGWLPLGRLRLSTRRPLGLARAWTWLRPDTRVLVYPALDPEAPPLPESLGDG
ncbi:MAG TPA: DUF58 domain-containing protein, partial [Arenimonas sp.]|nr:DUF58 domain-containing protein [Arenimonas sp.]